MRIDAHNPTARRINRRKVTPHHHHPNLLGVAHDRTITLHSDNAVDNGKMRFQCRIDVQNRIFDPGMVQLARSMGAPPHRVFLKLRLPNALPMIFSGLKVASGLAVVGALTGEFVGSDRGLGHVLVQASGNLNTALLFATLVVLSLIAMAFFYAVELVERVMIPWHVSQRSHPT